MQRFTSARSQAELAALIGVSRLLLLTKVPQRIRVGDVRIRLASSLSEVFGSDLGVEAAERRVDRGKFTSRLPANRNYCP